MRDLEGALRRQTQLKLITQTRGLLGRFGLFGSRAGAPADLFTGAAEGLMAAAEERALWDDTDFEFCAGCRNMMAVTR